MLSNQCRQYPSKDFWQLLSDNNIKQLFATLRNPTKNSISERINQTITRLLRVNKREDLFEAVSKTAISLQNSYNRHLRASPKKNFISNKVYLIHDKKFKIFY